jgi:diguanylate cyclase (GGDEF)-like protein
MLTGQYDGQWVEVQGLVHDVRESPTHVVLDLLLGDSSTTAITVRQPHVDYAHLVDSAIVLHAIVAPKFNAEYQLTGAHLLFPGLQSLTVTHAGAGDSFSLPPDEIDTLLRFTPGGTLNHRIHVRGAVTLDWPGRMICIQNGVHRLCATTSQRSEVTAGELVDLVGFPALGAFTPTLLEAKYHPRGQTVPILAKTVTASEALQGHNDIRLVTIEGRIIDLGRQRGDQILTISSGGLLFTSTLPDSNPAADSQTTLETLAVGSRVRVTGICSIQAAASSEDVGEASSVPQSFRILQRSAADIVVLQRPSWWNVERSLRMLGGALTLVLLALATIIFLRLRIRQQTATIRAQLTETAALKDAAEYQAMHDSLTGIYNRKAIFAALGREFDLAARSGSTTGVLMVDIDHFKQINDTHGHAAGDHVIQQSVQRILSAIRSTDLLGRYGGEEFLVVLTLCEREQVRACSERIRESLAASPIVFGGKSIFVTASVGAVAASYSLLPKRDAVAAADLALYEAKHGGRNCVAFHDLYAPSHTEVLIDRS